MSTETDDHNPGRDRRHTIARFRAVLDAERQS
ncbi:MAG: hypothetical protein QOI83_4524, partial [Streptomycetaceae bacterium]|nr:hypothetical protein [Streptomycetaceae bacterium]